MKHSAIFYDAEIASSSHVHKLPERSEIPESHRWNLANIFPDDATWESEFEAVKKMLPDVSRFRGKLSDSAGNLLECLTFRDRLEERIRKLFLYAGLKNDEDSRIGKYIAYRDRITGLMVQANEKTAFIQPEILDIPEERLRTFIEEHDGLKLYLHYMDDLLRSKEHVLPPEQEQLLAMTGEIATGPYNIFSMFNNADIKFPFIKDEEGKEVEVTKGRFFRFMESPDRRVRRDAFLALYGTYGNWTNTLAATLSQAIKKDIFYARARRYPSALRAALDEDNIPPQVYDNVIQTINHNLAPLHRYTALRKKMLKLKELQPWDLFVPLVSDIKFEMPYQESLETILEALQPLGKDYLQVLKTSFENRWLDVYENKGKRSGAYCWSTYGTHPFVLLNYNDTLNDMFTIAHEMGHAMHSYFSQSRQPFIYSDYTIFVAEVASTLNEALLMDYLLKTTDDRQKKLYLLNEYADQIRSTVYIQSLFAEFERVVHEKIEAGEALTTDILSNLNREIYSRYLGPAFSIDKLYEINWCRIPHFYYNFYVYKYVTGFSAATALARRIIAGDTEARDRYLHFLSRGSSDYSLNLLKDAGVDMTSPEPIEATTRLLDQLVSEMEELQNR